MISLSTLLYSNAKLWRQKSTNGQLQPHLNSFNPPQPPHLGTSTLGLSHLFNPQYYQAFDNFPSPAEADPVFTNNNYYYQYLTDQSHAAPIANTRPPNPAFDAAAFGSSHDDTGNDIVNASVVDPFADGPSASAVIEMWLVDSPQPIFRLGCSWSTSRSSSYSGLTDSEFTLDLRIFVSIGLWFIHS
ncbi:Protein of unknown function [Pyronema omphalodes CBS 100304]|uniref:Uncharacterized protein n=1 Tax=Pyronema omphalodes (strain CBS 100304) TaxID=1076935 RepID=U4LFP9_PYROM|nr:Protein of unknown function [Pyronema omphalodes CBS 100304]